MINVRKHAAERPDDANNIHITIIWYLAAIKGDMPDKICPVIMPGRETRPTAKRVLIVGINEALKAMFLAWMLSLWLLISEIKRSAAKLILFIQLAKIIPPSGIIYLG